MLKLQTGSFFRSAATGKVYKVRELLDGGAFVVADGYQTDFEGNLVLEKGEPKKERGSSLAGPMELVKAFAFQV